VSLAARCAQFTLFIRIAIWLRSQRERILDHLPSIGSKMFDIVKDWFVTNLEWVVVQRILGVLFMTTLATVILDRAFGLLSVWRQKIWFFLGVLVIRIFTIQYLPSGQSHLRSSIIYLVVYPTPPPTVFTLIGIANDGPIQTSVTNIYLSTIVDGRTYIGKPVEMPEKVSIPINMY
jgi:hypothetical protein